ncbi:DNA polymerase-3 subunit epsilon [Variovorax sp. HW608]|uniref:3'-5' exonuclease n=1 Tax=Variovorax sp. HW608 TaxID=1034889 RepID=UPI00081FE3DF|nr:3'-5' exonuclease [Variovorax sp. HW608]SCK29255.1 DNA polymerase-3 subunit epsilon [Variovorax sp. HW608]
MTGAFAAIKRGWLLYHLGDPRFRFMWDPPPPDEWVALDCETTGLDVRRDEIVAIAAVRIRGNRVLCSERLELLVKPERRAVSPDSVRVHGLRERDVAQGIAMDDALKQLMEFIGSRPLVGYYLEFDVAMIDRALFPMLGMGLPQPKIEVSALYYEYKNRQRPVHERGGDIDLRFATIMSDLGLPQRPAHDALNDAVMAALAFLKLRGLAA